MTSPLHVYVLGRVEYEDGLRMQQEIGRARAADLIPDTLLLLEHPAVLTLGRAAKPENVLASPENLKAKDVGLFETNRGGDVTFHGPGQWVGYPILKLEGKQRDVRAYVRMLEETLIRTVAEFGVSAGRISGWTGVWVGEKDVPGTAKIAAIGVHLSRWQTSHGFALNVNTDLSAFGLIVPCGIREAGVTSLQRQRGGAPIDMGEVAQALSKHLGELLGRDIVLRSPTMRTISVALTRSGPRGTAEVLCLKRREREGRSGFWQLVTGKIEAGETPAQAAVREVYEETGLRCDVMPLGQEGAFVWGTEENPRICVETPFQTSVSGDVRITLSEEHEVFEWLNPEEAVERLPFAGLRRAARQAVNSHLPCSQPSCRNA